MPPAPASASTKLKGIALGARTRSAAPPTRTVNSGSFNGSVSPQIFTGRSEDQKIEIFLFALRAAERRLRSLLALALGSNPKFRALLALLIF
jgi:hypothetical protein